MKTLIYLNVIAVISIQVMGQNQTADNQAKQDYEKFYLNNTNKVLVDTEEKDFLLSIKNPNDLMQLADDLNQKANALRKEAEQLDQQAQVKKILASELAAKITYEQFVLSRNYADSMANLLPHDDKTTLKIKHLIEMANYNLRLAKEMREEAYSYINNPTRLGTLSNAEEKEFTAINKLNEALLLVKKAQFIQKEKTKPSYQIPVNISEVAKN